MDNKNVSVIIGRFQTPSLHSGHMLLINKAINAADHILFLLACTPVPGTRDNPLDFISRKQMISSHLESLLLPKHKTLTILPIANVESDDAWSESVDSLIESTYPSTAEYDITLFHGRDSFWPKYSGKFKGIYTKEIYTAVSSGKEEDSGSRRRKEVGLTYNSAFREGVIYGAQSRYPTFAVTVDIGVFKLIDNEPFVLVGCKGNDKHYRLPGGFVEHTEDPRVAAKRELEEETNLAVSLFDLQIIHSIKVNDWRYRENYTSLITVLYAVNGDSRGVLDSQIAKAGDDLDRVVWVSVKELKMDYRTHPSHRPLFDSLSNYIRALEKHFRGKAT